MSFQPSKKRKLIPFLGSEGSYTGPSEAFIEVIQNGAKGMGKAVYVFTSNQGYLFNCPENTERLFAEHQMKISRLQDIFITHSSWRNVGGLNGMIMALRNGGMSVVHLHGSGNLVSAIRSAQFYQEMSGSSLQLVDKSCSEQTYEDASVRVEYVTLYGHLNDKLSHRMDMVVEVSPNVAYAYILTLKAKPRNVRLEKCISLKVPVGPCLKQLQLGNSVTLEDGRVVTPDDVLAPELPCPNFLVVECPHHGFLEGLINCRAFEKFVSPSDLKLNAIVHFTGSSVFRTSEYQTWMGKFNGDTKHIVLNSDTCDVAPHSEAVFRLNSHLNFLQPQVFPLLHSHRTISDSSGDNLTQFSNVLSAKPWLQYWLRPDLGKVSDSQPFVALPNTYLDPIRSNPEMMDALEKARQQQASLDDLTKSSTDSDTFPEITFYGTASACPLKSRNLSGLLLQLSESTSMLCDCGEGTFYQMVTLYGFEECQRMLRRIKAIFISHLHADHTFGLPHLLLKRYEAFLDAGLPYEPPYLVAAPKIYQIFGLFSECIGDVAKWCVPVWPKIESPSERTDSNVEAMKSALKLRHVEFVRAIHPMYARSLVLISHGGKKIVYSGDTRPCDELIAAGVDADLLIHEATMEDDLQEEAVRKRHSTVAEALQVGADMRAKFVLLTHFSGRYAKLPLVELERSDIKFSVAFDFMKFALSRVDGLTDILPLLKILYQEDYNDMLMRTEKRILRKELLNNQMKVKN